MEKEMELDFDTLSQKIKDIVQDIKIDSNPEELDGIKKLIKKNVPFTLRGYFSAYLLREMLKKNTRREKPARKEIKKSAQVQVEAPVAEEKAAPKPRQARPIPEGAKTLYINLGKMGRIYAKDLVELICEDTGITKDDIYMVRVHDKYSFVSMSEENCNKAIDKLLGKVIKGRTIQINISNREKKDDSKKVEEQ
ncbi:DbpA RNA binding domain-containing protein [Bullifex porci]|uniref:DbpA RNA binding domain-containing protein n=1 Tax=Bullifex porci TaxID=2606638 RepID=UPI0023F34916|nr:DbpA RNA binding domain-containing protein [Bullifex porci]MDD7588244.1 DbpA RNA binding domain-containing protein [Bullifex porci]